MASQLINLPAWFDGQKIVNAQRKRYSILASHRGWYKTSFSVRLAIEWILTGRDMGWWSPTHKAIQNAWIDFARAVPGHQEWFNKSDHTFTAQIGGKKLGTIYFFSMEVPENALGWTLPGIADELGLWDDGVFEGVVKPIVNKYGKDTWFFGSGTPNPFDPFNDFYKLLDEARYDPEEWASWIIPVYGCDLVNGELVPNVHVNTNLHNPESPFRNFEHAKKDYESAVRNGREKNWLINHLCKFLQDSGGQFVNVEAASCIYPERLDDNKWIHPQYKTEESRKDCWLQMGIDIAVENDYTVVIVMDKNTNQMIYMNRFLPRGNSRYEVVEQAIANDYYTFNPALVHMDATGMGGRYVETLPRLGVHLNDWGEGRDKMKFGMNKEPIMDHLSSLIAGVHIKLFNLDELKNELLKMSREARPSGVFKIAAPKGEHDDIPIALALACIGIHPQQQVVYGSNTESLKGIPSWWNSVKW